MSMTQTSTAAETKTCYFCQGPATHLKRDVELEFDDECNEIEVITELPIDTACNEYYYDGTETYPALLPLA